MKTKVYRVIAIMGRKRNILWESAEFDGTDGTAEYVAFKQALREREKCSMRFLLAGRKTIANREQSIDIIRCTK